MKQRKIVLIVVAVVLALALAGTLVVTKTDLLQGKFFFSKKDMQEQFHKQFPTTPDLTKKYKDLLKYFKPTTPDVEQIKYVTRCDLSKMIIDSNGWALISPESPSFVDVPKTSDCYPYVETAVAQGIIVGYGGVNSGKFGPNDPVARAAAIKYIVKGAEFPVCNYKKAFFTDVPLNSWFVWAVDTAMHKGVISFWDYVNGGGKLFYPGDMTTFDQAASWVSLSIWAKEGGKGSNVGHDPRGYSCK